jgi:hypothetical protein
LMTAPMPALITTVAAAAATRHLDADIAPPQSPKLGRV